MTVERYVTAGELAPLFDGAAAVGLLSVQAPWLLAQARRDAVPHEARLREIVGGATARHELGVASHDRAARYIELADRSRVRLAGNEVSTS